MSTHRASSRAHKAPHGQRNDHARMAFASWLVLTPGQRKPRTQDELARDLGVASSTLSSWRRLPLIQAVTSDWRKAYSAHFSEVVDAMLRKARAGNVPAARLMAEILGELAPTKIEQTNVGDSPWGQLMEEVRDARLRVLDGGKTSKRDAS